MGVGYANIPKFYFVDKQFIFFTSFKVLVIKSYPKEKDIIKVPRFDERAGFTTSKQRSKIMSKIRGKNSVPELLLRRALWAKNIRFRIHRKELPGKPDIVIEKYKLAIFVDGDFWHGYEWGKRKPKTNEGFWIPKIERNMERDRYVNATLAEMGYTVMRFWEHDVTGNLKACVNQIELYLETVRISKIPYRS